MRIILGIGNPGSRYQLNRHNIGFMLLDYFANKNSLSFSPSKGDYYFASGGLEQSHYILIKPTTYVNNSGLAASDALKLFNIDVTDFLVVYDDINLEFTKLRVRASGGDGGHNGISSIIYHLSTNKFPRLRIGVGGDFEKGEMATYVLTNFNNSEIKLLNKTFDEGSALIEEFIKGGLKQMLDANSKLSNSN